MGLAVASDLGIALQTVALAVLLHQRHMVSLASLDYTETGPVPAGCGGQRRRVGVIFGWLGGALHRR
jgi:hypothetical protein